MDFLLTLSIKKVIYGNFDTDKDGYGTLPLITITVTQKIISANEKRFFKKCVSFCVNIIHGQICINIKNSPNKLKNQSYNFI